MSLDLNKKEIEYLIKILDKFVLKELSDMDLIIPQLHNERDIQHYRYLQKETKDKVEQLKLKLENERKRYT